jgi:hypothetical protein
LSHSPQIDDAFAFAMACQVSAGLAAGDMAAERARSSLLAIGLMLYNASDDKHVRDALDLSSRMRIRATSTGGVTMDGMNEREARANVRPLGNVTPLDGEAIAAQLRLDLDAALEVAARWLDPNAKETPGGVETRAAFACFVDLREMLDLYFERPVLFG